MSLDPACTFTRREAGRMAAAAASAASILAPARTVLAAKPFRLEYVLSSCMYGKMALEVILPELPKVGAERIDIWRLPHGNQREQIDEMGAEAFARMLRRHGARLGVSTCYPLGPFGLAAEMKFVSRLGGTAIVCGSRGPREPKGTEAKQAVKQFLEQMKPHVEQAEALGVTIAIENHDRQLLYHPDALRYFAQFNRSRNLGIAFAPHHLHQFVPEIPKLIEDLGGQNLPFVYGQEHSAGIRKKAPKHIEMQQLPGFGKLDYRPLLAALKKVGFSGFFEIFMHPVPRGIPILPTAAEVTAAINRSRAYLDRCLEEIH